MAKKTNNQKSFEEVIWDLTNKFRDTLLSKLLSGELRIKDAEKLVEEAL